MNKEYLSKSERDTAKIGEELAKSAVTGDVFCLSGGLSAGKTVFAKGFAKGLGVDSHVTSPTFTFVNEYDEGRFPFYHFDAYRLNGIEDAVCFDFYEYFETGVTLIEWAENVAEILPENICKITLERVDGDDCARKITIENTMMTKGFQNDFSD